MQKKILAIALALAMMLSMIPMAAFASSDNMVTRVVTVTGDADLETDCTTPVLRLENDNNTWSATEIIRLTVPAAAEWNADIENKILVANGLTPDNPATPLVDEADTDIVVGYITDQTIEITLSATMIAAGVIVDIPMDVTFDDAEGAMKVTVDAMDSALDSGTYTFAMAASGATVVTVGSSKTVNEGADQVGAAIVIDETVVGSFAKGAQSFRVRLPEDFEWDLAGATQTTVTASNLRGWVDADADGVIDAGEDVALSAAGQITLAGAGDRDLVVSFTIGKVSSVRGSITISPAFTVTKDAEVGDVEIDVTNKEGDLSSVYGMKIAEYKDFGVTIELKDDSVKEVYAGRFDAEFKTATITIKEDVAGSLARNRSIDFELPSWVALSGDVEYTVTAGGAIAKTVIPLVVDTADQDHDGSKVDNVPEFDEREWSISLPSMVAVPGALKIEFKLPLTVQGTSTGDITLKMDGAGIDEEELVVAKAVAPVTVTVDNAGKTIQAGLRKQAAPNITIKEAYAGALRDNNANNAIDIVLKDALNANSIAINDFDWEVTAGDIELDEDATDIYGNIIRLVVDADSSKPSTIVVKGVLLDLDKTVPNGILRADINGTALSDNAAYNDFAGRIARFDYVTVGDAGTVATSAKSAFVIGSKDYTVNGVTAAADVAPYIKDGRTFVAVRYIAYALGVSPDSILWDGKDTVTVLGATRIIQLKIGSADMYVNGAKITMDTKAEITSGRSFVPVAWIARAMGVNVAWDQATMTATFN